MLSKLPILIFLTTALLSKEPYREPWGRDADLGAPQQISILKNHSWPARISDAIIRFHQNVISPVDGPRSHFRPTSSRYMQLAIQRYGFIRGYLMGCDRLLRENGEEWVYNKVEIDGKVYKYDPAWFDKHKGLRLR